MEVAACFNKSSFFARAIYVLKMPNQSSTYKNEGSFVNQSTYINDEWTKETKHFFTDLLSFFEQPPPLWLFLLLS